MLEILKALARLATGSLTALLIFGVLQTLSLVRAFSAGMIKPEFVIHEAATIIGAISILKFMAGDRAVAKRLGAMSLAGFLLANIPLNMPGIWNLGRTGIGKLDSAAEDRARELRAPRVTTPPRIPAPSPAPPQMTAEQVRTLVLAEVARAQPTTRLPVQEAPVAPEPNRTTSMVLPH